MKSISELVNERRRTFVPYSKRSDGKNISTDMVNNGGRLMKMAKMKDVDGKKASNNGSKGKWELNPPAEDNIIDLSDTKKLSKNKKMLLAKFRAEEDFFIEGKAGWAKTTLIKKMASTFKLNVLVVYLDKIMASDLGGIPVPERSERGAAYQELAMPGWAAIMYENPDKNFLLFFDEMNQAAPDVMNALMPIVLDHTVCGQKFENFFVGAAGNLKAENRGVNELSGPLLSRFKPIIHWETNTPAEWADTFEYLHKTWDNSLGTGFVTRFEQDAEIFANPRELEHKIFKFVYKLVTSKGPGDNDAFDADFFLERLEQLRDPEREDSTERTDHEKLAKLAEFIYDYIQTNGESAKEKTETKSGKGRQQLDPDVQKLIEGGMREGFISWDEADGSQTRYAVTKTNIYDFFDGDICNAEQIERFCDKLEADGIKWKYKNDAEVKKDPDFKAGRLKFYEE